jgi:hypothetical protein
MMTKFLQDSLQYKELRNFQAIFYGFRDISIYIFIFLTVCDNSVMTYVENFRFSYDIIRKVYMIERFLFLQMTVKIQANPCMIFYSAQTSINMN